MTVKCLDSSFSFDIANALKQFFYVTNDVNMCFLSDFLFALLGSLRFDDGNGNCRFNVKNQ